MVFISILLVRGIWSGISYIRINQYSYKNRMDDEDSRWSGVQPTWFVGLFILKLKLYAWVWGEMSSRSCVERQKESNDRKFLVYWSWEPASISTFCNSLALLSRNLPIGELTLLLSTLYYLLQFWYICKHNLATQSGHFGSGS